MESASTNGMTSSRPGQRLNSLRLKIYAVGTVGLVFANQVLSVAQQFGLQPLFNTTRLKHGQICGHLPANLPCLQSRHPETLSLTHAASHTSLCSHTSTAISSSKQMTAFSYANLLYCTTCARFSCQSLAKK